MPQDAQSKTPSSSFVKKAEGKSRAEHQSPAPLPSVDKPQNLDPKIAQAPKRTAKRAPTVRMKAAAKLMSENGRNGKVMSKGEIMKAAGYSKTIQEAPSKIMNSETFQELLEQAMPSESLTQVHKRLLNSKRLDSMTFAPYLEESDFDGAGLTDEDIMDMLADVNCTVRKIVKGERARTVYFWTYDAAAQNKALELAYKVKGYLTKAGDPDDPGKGGTFNFNFGNQNFVKRD